MKKRLLKAGWAVAMILSCHAQAKNVTFTAQLNNYGGDGAYLAIYLTNSDGIYQQTLWVAGTKSKHYKHLSDWARGSGINRADYDGLTGASISSGQTLNITRNVDDAFIDSGYQIRVDTAVEDMRDNPADIIVALTTTGTGKVVNGNGYVNSFTYVFE